MRFKNLLCLFSLLIYSVFFNGISYGEMDRQKCSEAFRNLSRYDNILDLSGDTLYYLKQDVKKYLDLCKAAMNQTSTIMEYSYDYWGNIENHIKQNTTLSVSIEFCNEMIKAIYNYDTETKYNKDLSNKQKETYLYIKKYCEEWL